MVSCASLAGILWVLSVILRHRGFSPGLRHAKVSMTQDRYLGRRLTDRQTADVLEALFESGDDENVPKPSFDLAR